MNILLICTKVPFPPKDGGSLAIEACARGMAARGHKVFILAANTHKHRIEMTATEPHTNIHVESVPVNTDLNFFSALYNLVFSNQPYHVSRFYSTLFCKSLKNVLSGNAFDIVQLEGPHMGIYIPCIRQFFSKTLILRAHNVETALWSEILLHEKNRFKKVYLKIMVSRLAKFEKLVVSRVNAIMPISPADEAHFKTLAGNKPVEVISYGLNLERFITGKVQAESQSVFYLGALDWIPNQKGLLWFLDKVWPLVSKTNPSVQLHIGGRNAPEWLIEKIVRSKACFHGEVEDSGLFMQQYGIMIVPLFEGSGIRIKILEGMAWQKAIVSTPKGIEGMDVLHNREIVVASADQEFASGIIQLLSNEAYRKLLGLHSRKFVEKEFNNFVLSERIETFYKRVMK